MPSVSAPGGAVVPLWPEKAERGRGRLGVRVQHRHEPVLLDHPDAAHRRRPGGVDARERRTVSGRAKDPRVQQARQPNVGGVLGLARDLGLRVEPPGRTAHDLEFAPPTAAPPPRPASATMAWPRASAP